MLAFLSKVHNKLGKVSYMITSLYAKIEHIWNNLKFKANNTLATLATALHKTLQMEASL